jgi:O-antigen/teichoic acid export membrane protein
VDAAAKTAVFLALVYSARELGPAAFGEFALVYTAAQITALLADLGLTSLVLRQGARSAGVQRVSFWTALTLNVAASLVCALGLVAAFALIHGTGTATAAIYSPTLVLLTVTTSLEIAAIAAQRPVRAAASRFAGNVCALGLTIVLLQIQESPEAVAAAFLGGGVVKLLFIASATRPLVPAIAVRPRVVVPLLRRGAPFYGSAIAAFLYQRVDVLMLGAIAGVSVAGEYVAAYRILDGILLLPVAVVAAFLPSWAERRDAKGVAGRAASLVVLLLVCIGVLAGAELLLARGFLVDLLYGGEYASSAPILAVLALSVPIFYADIALVWIAYVRGHEKRVAALGIVALVTNIAINVVLIRSFGGLGAAMTTVVTEATISLGYAFTLGLHRKEHRARALEVLATAGAYAGALVALVMLCVIAEVHWALSCLAVAVLGTALLLLVYRREERHLTPSSASRVNASSIVSNLADQEC